MTQSERVGFIHECDRILIKLCVELYIMTCKPIVCNRKEDRDRFDEQIIYLKQMIPLVQHIIKMETRYLNTTVYSYENNRQNYQESAKE